MQYDCGITSDDPFADPRFRALHGGWRQGLSWELFDELAICAVTPGLPVEWLYAVFKWTPTWRKKFNSMFRGDRFAEQGRLNAGTIKQGNPAAWRGNLALLLPARKKGLKRHHPAMPFVDVPRFFEKLQESQGLSARALELTILTAARTSEVLQAGWSEFDLRGATWTVPASRMKAGREHRVPLSPAAVELLNALSTDADHVFPGQVERKPLSNMAMEMCLRRMGQDQYTVHGFRSSFRDWVGEATNFPREVAEMALAHQVGSEVERAYRRGDSFTRRRKLMTAWAEFCLSLPEGKAPASHRP